MNIITFSKRLSDFVDAADVNGNIRNSRLNLQYIAQIDSACVKAGITTGAVYPFIGGHVDSHKYNFLDPRDLDNAFRLNWGTGVIHNQFGIKGGGSSVIANTNFNPYNNLEQFNSHASFYTSTTTSEGSVDIDCYPNNGLFFDVYVLSGIAYSVLNSVTNFASFTPSKLNGFYLSVRLANNIHNLYKDNNLVANQTAINNGQLPSANVTIGGRLTVGFYSTKIYSFASVGNGMSDDKAKVFSHDIYVAQRALGRA